METLNFRVSPAIAKIILSGNMTQIDKEDKIDCQRFIADWSDTVDYFRGYPSIEKSLSVCDVSGNHCECVTIQGVQL